MSDHDLQLAKLVQLSRRLATGHANRLQSLAIRARLCLLDGFARRTGSGSFVPCLGHGGHPRLLPQRSSVEAGRESARAVGERPQRRRKRPNSEQCAEVILSKA